MNELEWDQILASKSAVHQLHQFARKLEAIAQEIYGVVWLAKGEDPIYGDDARSAEPITYNLIEEFTFRAMVAVGYMQGTSYFQKNVAAFLEQEFRVNQHHGYWRYRRLVAPLPTAPGYWEEYEAIKALCPEDQRELMLLRQFLARTDHKSGCRAAIDLYNEVYEPEIAFVQHPDAEKAMELLKAGSDYIIVRDPTNEPQIFIGGVTMEVRDDRMAGGAEGRDDSAEGDSRGEGHPRLQGDR